MAEHSAIEWTEATWNPIAGCSIASPGCSECYAMRRVAPRLAANPATPHYAGTVKKTKTGYVWTGKLNLASDRVLTLPLRWKKPRTIFVNSTSDLFHEGVPDEWIDRIFAVMALCPQHTFQVLTKRAARMRQYLSSARAHPVAIEAMERTLIEHTVNPKSDVGSGCVIKGDFPHLAVWPLPNVWLGVSAERQQEADERIPELLATPAAIRFVSAEPLLGPIDLSAYLYLVTHADEIAIEAGRAVLFHDPVMTPAHEISTPRIDQVIVGGMTGQRSRPMHPDWARNLRDQCAAAGVPFFFKQWGDWAQVSEDEAGDALYGEFHGGGDWIEACMCAEGDGTMFKIGKKRAGRLLDGVEHNGMPVIARAAPA